MRVRLPSAPPNLTSSYNRRVINLVDLWVRLHSKVMVSAPSDGRKRGRIEQRGDALRVVYYAGQNPVTGNRSYLREMRN